MIVVVARKKNKKNKEGGGGGNHGERKLHNLNSSWLATSVS
jgi:hypothetical protein